MKKIILILMILSLLAGCSSKTETTGTDNALSDKTSQNSTGQSSTSESTNTEYFSTRDFEVGYEEESSAVITLTGDSAECSSNAVSIQGSKITILDEGTYIVSGTLNNGMIVVNTDKSDKTQIVLAGADIHSETSAALYVLQSDKVFVTLKEGTINTLSSGESYEAIDENNIDAVIFSKEDLTLNGSGKLVIDSPAGHGIVSKDSLTITSGEYEITAASHALSGKDDVCIANAKFVLDAGKDGIHAENDDDETLGYVYIQSGTFEIEAEGDGISAASYMTIEDGSFSIVTGGGAENAAKQTSDSWGHGMMDRGRGGHTSTSSTSSSEDSTSIKGIKASGNLTINGGTFVLNTADDAVHSNTSVTIGGGTFEIASGDDGFHADETLSICDGTINITESYEGLEGLHVLVSGGEIELVSSDDGINAAGGTDSSGFGGMRGNDKFGGGMSSSSDGSIVVSGGSLHITAYGDGLDANGTLEISGGYTVVLGPTSGDTATLDYDVSGIITGGTFIGTGAYSMAQSFSGSEQGVIAVGMSNQSAGTQVTLTDEDGKELFSYTPELSFGVVILSSPDMVSGKTYTLHIGEISQDFEAN